MKTNHTPGPWTIGDSGIIYDDNAQVAAMPYGGTVAELDANARLIAAAPDLLAALEGALLALEECANFTPTRNANT